MRKLHRLELSPATIAALRRLTDKVTSSRGAAARAKKAGALWNQKPQKLFTEVQTVLAQMASGRNRCMYCEDGNATDIEHFYPKSKYPERAFAWNNYLWACSYCNSNRKRSQFPLLGKRPGLIDPTKLDPAKHLHFLPSTGQFTHRTRQGKHSIDVFGLNDSSSPRNLPQGRKDAFDKLQILLEKYHQLQRRRSKAQADELRGLILREPFSAVLAYLVAIAAGPRTGHQTLRPGIPAIVSSHGVGQWLDRSTTDAPRPAVAPRLTVRRKPSRSTR